MKVILKTAGMFDEYEQQDIRIMNSGNPFRVYGWRIALVMRVQLRMEICFLGLTDQKEKDKELFLYDRNRTV